MIELAQVCAGYAHKQVLYDVSLCFAPQTVTCIVGPNGCGKTTLLSVAARLLPVQSGAVYLDGKPVQAYAPKAFAQQVAVLPQVRQVPQIPVEPLVEHGRFPHQGFERRRTQRDAQIVQEAMQRMDIWALRHANTARLSGGERQKAYLAMLLAQDTQTMLLDEPTTFLDVHHQLELLGCIRQLAHEAGKAVGLVLHDLCQALAVADTLCVLEQGRVAYLGAPEPLLQTSLLQQVFGVHVQRLQDAQGDWHYVCSPCRERGAAPGAAQW